MTDFSQPLFDPKAVTANDICMMAANQGLVDTFNEYSFAQDNDFVHYLGYNGKQFMWYVAFIDTENGENKHYIARFFAKLNEKGEMAGDWGGCPEFDDKSFDEIEELFTKFRVDNSTK